MGKLGATELKILETAVVCRTAGAARYLWPRKVERLVRLGFLVVKSEWAATITPAGLEVFLKGG